jgi:type VI secretion system secreted protein VgrG
MPELTQENRLLTISTPLGDDVVLLTGFSGTEEFSRPFHYHLDLLSEDTGILPKDIVGKAVGWTIDVQNNPRHFHGIVNRFQAGGLDLRGRRVYRAEVVPWLWFLTLTSDCRIFQEKNVPTIISAIFSDLGFTDFKKQLSGTYDNRVYCVQYRESAFNFVSRLMEEEGIFYFFEHEESKHTLVMADRKTAYFDSPDATVKYGPGSRTYGYISSWERLAEYRTGKWTQTDYDFENPSTKLKATVSTLMKYQGVSKIERYDYPGEYLTTGLGGERVKVRIEAEEAANDGFVASGGCISFTPGAKFTLEDAPTDAENAEYVITSVTHTATDQSYDAGGRSSYDCAFKCIESKVLYRSPRYCPRPVVHGPQTAVVVGPSGEEIYTDKYARVKVQFHWDRVGTNDENSSCWLRVGQTLAGNAWGSVFLPRIGQEVIVSFLEGNPDQPLVTGLVYNAEQMPPYAMPDNMTRTVIKTRSTPGGDGDTFNELYFEDKKDNEDIYFHAQKDFHRKVEHDDDLKVDHDQTITVKNARTIEIQEADDKLTVTKGNRMVTISSGNLVIAVSKGAMATTISKGDCNLEVTKGKMSTLVGAGDYAMEISKGKMATLVGTGDCTLDVSKGNRSVTVGKGNDSHTVSTGNRSVTIDKGNDSLSIKMGNQTTKVDLGKIGTEAMQAIELKVGQSSLKIDQTGVTIKGMMIKIEGQVMAEMKAVIGKVSADALLQLKGGITMIG